MVGVPINEQRRAAIAAATVTVVSRAGLRGLTHRAVDSAAGVPPGTTSNYHRTRAALLEAAADEAGTRVLDWPEPEDARAQELARDLLAVVVRSLSDVEALRAAFTLRLGEDGRRRADRSRAAQEGAPRPGGTGSSGPDYRRLVLSLEGLLLAVATGDLSAEDASAHAEALVRSVAGGHRRWFNIL